MPRTLTASAPGKSILFGEHAVVYRRPALVAAIDRRLAVTLGAHGAGAGSPTAEVRLSVPQLGVDETLPWREILAYAGRCREAWRVWAGGAARSPFTGVRGAGAAHLVKVALGEAARARGEQGGLALELTVRSELPAGSGFGSSAAAAVAVVAGYFALRGERQPAAGSESERIEAVALEVERRQHGLPSGVDAATVLHGGVLWAERPAADPARRETLRGSLHGAPLHIEPLAAAASPRGAELLAGFAVFDSGRPAESTGVVVAAVRERAAADPARYKRLWQRMEAAAHGFRDLLEACSLEQGAGRSLATARARAVELVAAAGGALEELGVVPEPVRELIRRVEAAGGAAKVSGAGSLTGPGAGSLLVVHPEPETLADWRFLDGLERLPVRLGGPGLRIEAAEVPA